eukprot:11177875-Lingulodinium_polyedra.AAC.1
MALIFTDVRALASSHADRGVSVIGAAFESAAAPQLAAILRVAQRAVAGSLGLRPWPPAQRSPRMPEAGGARRPTRNLC